MKSQLQSKIFSSHDYKSARDLEDALNNFSQAHQITSVNQVPRDYQIQGPVPQIVRGYDVIVQYEENARQSATAIDRRDTYTNFQNMAKEELLN